VEEVEPDPANPAVGQPVAQPRPALSAVSRLVDPAFRTAVDHLPRQPLLVVRGGVDHVRALGVQDEIDDADLLVDVQHLLPRRPAVRRLEDPALGVLGIEVTHRRDVDDIRIRRMDRDAGDVVGIAQPHVRPGLAGIGRLVHAVARVGAPRGERVARANPDDVGVRWRHGDVADRQLRLTVEHRLECRPVVRRFPEAAGPEPDVERVEVIFRRRIGHGDVRRPRPHAVRAQIPVGEGSKQRLVECRGRLHARRHAHGRGQCGQRAGTDRGACDRHLPSSLCRNSNPTPEPHCRDEPARRSLRRLLSTKLTLAGRSPSRPMKYANHSLPNGTYTRTR
jgi:hypothetical protein